MILVTAQKLDHTVEDHTSHHTTFLLSASSTLRCVSALVADSAAKQIQLFAMQNVSPPSKLELLPLSRSCSECPHAPCWACESSLVWNVCPDSHARVELLSRFAYDFACFACRRFLLSFFGMLRFVDCVCFWSFVRFSLGLTIFDCPRALCSYSNRFDMLSPESIQTSGKPCPSGIHSSLSTTTSTFDVFDFASSTSARVLPVLMWYLPLFLFF